MNQGLKIGIFILIAIGSFLIFPEIGNAWCSPAVNKSKNPAACTWLTLEAVYECNGGITKNSEICGCGWRFANSCDDTGYLCKSGACPADYQGSLNTWTKCNKFPDTPDHNGQFCQVLSSSGATCVEKGDGVWDASERKCVQCEGGRIEKKICGSAGTVSTETCNGALTYCISLGCTVAGNGKCESACGVDVSPECDEAEDKVEVAVSGGVCNNCIFVGKGPPPFCGNGRLDAGEECDPPQDAACPGRCQNCKCAAPPGTCGNGQLDTGEDCDIGRDGFPGTVDDIDDACEGYCQANCTCNPCGPKGNQTYEADGKTVSYSGLVPCGRYLYVNGNCRFVRCELCHLFVMLDGIMDFLLFKIVPPLVILLFVAGGGLYILGAGLLGTTGKPETVKTAKSLITAVIIGLLIIFIAWILVNTFFMFIGTTSWGSMDFKSGWFKINCPIPLE